ncbi:MAG: amidohydrolase family protein [Fimbriimonas sp.]
MSKGKHLWIPVALVAVQAAGQSSVPAVSRLHAIVDARVEVGDGRVLERATVVIQNGLIVAVGPDVVVPPGAEVFAGKGLTVYPGFIDAYTTRGVKPPEAKPQQDNAPSSAEVGSAFMREANRKQVRPELEARQYLDLTEEVRKPYLAAGFTTIMAVPGDAGLRGQGTLVNLSGRAPRESVVVPSTGLAVSWGYASSDNVYPVSLLGSISHFRQAMIDAQWQASLRDGGGRAYSDPALESLARAVRERRRFFIEADTTAEIDRAGRLAGEFNLDSVLVGGLQAWRRAEGKRPWVLALTPGAEPKAPEGPKPGEAPAEPGDDPGNDADDATRIDERRRLYREATANPGLLAKAGHRFALTTKGAKDPATFMGNLRKAVAEGLTREAALRALTVDGATLLGVGRQMGTVEAGKMATVVVMSGDFLDEKTKVRMLYIDGWRVDPAAPGVTASPRPAAGHKERR